MLHRQSVKAHAALNRNRSIYVAPESGGAVRQPGVSLTGRRGQVCAAAKGSVYIIADDLAKTYDGDKMLFESLTFSVVAGDKLAVVGANGAGKSSLLKLIAGKESHDTGVLTRNKGATIGWLPQDPQLPKGMTVLQAVLASDSLPARVVQEYQVALAGASKAGAAVMTKELTAAIEKMDAHNAWELDAEAKRILDAVGIKEDMLGAKVEKLSGGQQKRVALAAALLGQPDVLILDEPTNHMDVQIISWLEKELKKKEEMAVVLVSHDRAFIEATCSRILELDNGRAVMHAFGGPGSYEQFKEARSLRRAAQASAAADARTLFRRESEWVVKQPKARQAKSQARVKSFYELVDRVKDVPPPDLKVDFGDQTMVRQGNKVVKLDKVTFNAGGRDIIKNFTYEFAPGERLGIVGRNGAGKSTLLNLIAGINKPTSGQVIPGETLNLGYFTQQPPVVPENLRVIDYIKEIADTQKARKEGSMDGGDSPEVLLEKLGFARPRQYQRAGQLSGGERRRLHLATVLVARPNLLILDEPTNDLDLNTVEVVEEYVRNYKGVLLVVSHDRHFMDNVADRLMVVADGGVQLFDGAYTDYLETQIGSQAGKTAEAEAEQSGSGSGKSSAPVAAAPAAKAPKARKLGFYEQEEYKKLSNTINKLTKERDTLDKKVMALAQSGTDMAGLDKASTRMGVVSNEIEVLTDRWLELAEVAGDI